MAEPATDGPAPVDAQTGERVYEDPTFDDLKWPPEPVYTYAQLYEKLVRQVSHEEAWGRVQRLLVFGTLFVLPIMVVMSPRSERWYQVWNSLTFVLVALLVISIIFFAWAHNRSVANTAAAVMARLIVAARSPRTGEQGLNSEEISRLRHVAEDEQQAADWRGSIVTTLIFTLVLTAVVAAVREVGEEMIASLIEVATGPELTFIYDVMWLFMWAMALIGFAYVAFNLFGYYRRFISGEMANRVLLLATAEALTTLQDCGLLEAVTLSFEEKRAVIGYAGYQFSRERLSFSWKDGMPFTEPDLRPNLPADWYLEPLIPKLRATLPQTLLAVFNVPAACAIGMDNLIYGGLLTLRAKNRRFAYERLGRQTSELPRLRKRDK